jgi:hypothetical protein
MAAKSVKLDGFGVIHMIPINLKEVEAETVDSAGNPLTHKMVGERARSIYVNTDGIEVPRNQVCKKFVVEDEEIIAQKFNPTKEVIAENISVIDDNGLIYRGLDRKFYNISCSDQKITDLVLKEGKSLIFPICFGSGYKIWQGVLTNWNNRLLLVACRGDIAKELEKYNDDTVEIEIGLVPQQKNMKKLVMAMIQ